VAAEVRTVEFTGAQSQIDLSTAAGPIAVCATDRPALRPGDRTQLQLPAQQLHFFESGSGLRLGAGEPVA
jgi:ABC-type sugar transport system ATPase subunit